jgi:hypothetical protein
MAELVEIVLAERQYSGIPNLPDRFTYGYINLIDLIYFSNGGKKAK